MFLICTDRDAGIRSVARLSSSLRGITCGPIESVPLKDRWLAWSSCKAHENLHVFADGIIIGKLDFQEPHSDRRIYHVGNMPAALHPLATGLRISTREHRTLVQPFGITNSFYAGGCVSDMQLLIADVEGFVPSPEGVAVLASVGFFPGNITLFQEIRKIPLLATYDVDTGQLTTSARIPYRTPDDRALLERLKSIVPDHPSQYLALSGGYDSRLVLGVMRQRGILPHLLHFQGAETEAVHSIADQLGLPCTTITDATAPLLAPEVYTLITDAQIYFRGGNYSRARNEIRRGSLFHMGLFSDSVVKNTYPKAVRYRRIGTNIQEALVAFALLLLDGDRIPGLCEFNSLETLKSYLLQELSFGYEYCSFRTNQEWANWFQYLHAGLRWTPAHVADLSPFVQPVFLLSDLQALSLGISSGAWANFACARLRRLNAGLLPGVTVPYYDAGPYRPQKAMPEAWTKVRSEYLNGDYVRKHVLGLAKPARYQASSVGVDEEVSVNARDFRRYFTGDFDQIARGADYPRSLRRAAITVGHALQFLGH